ncbi:MAG: hypothetical protein HYT93_01005 [Parcubacteria group bacterium]|nr:hypothetical protein [Parcubacteria group bacterium]
MADIKLLADKAARLRREKNLTVPGAVQRVLRENGFRNRSDFKEIMSDVCAELQRRATARRKKNKRLGRKSEKMPEQLELRYEEARQMADERRDDLLPDL